MAILFALSFILSFLRSPPIVDFGAALAIALVETRRLHDMNRTGWWAAAATLTPVVLMMALLKLFGPDEALLGASALMLTLIVLIGSIPGTPAPNRFGPPAPFTWLRLLRGG